MSDFGDFGSPLPSYPTLPSPPNTDQHYQGDLISTLADPTSNTTTVTPPPTFTTSLELGDYDFPLNWQQQDQQQPSPHARDLAGTSVSFNSPSTTSSSLLAGDLGSRASPDASMPIYATVRKPAASSPRLRSGSGSPFTNTSAPGSKDSSGMQSAVMQTPPTGPLPDSVATLGIRVKYLEQFCSKLSREKSEMEEGFGRQRKSFMNQMAQTDAKLSLCKHTVDKYAKEVQELSKQVLARDEELQNVTIAAGITEAAMRERFEVKEVKYEEEIASLRKIVSVQSQDTDQAMQQERELWQQEKAALLKDLEQMRRDVLVATPSRGASSPPKSPSPNENDPDLEISMTKAAEDAKLLQAVVLPLEKEIQLLKAQLNKAESKLNEKEAMKETSVHASANVSLIDLDTSLSMTELDSSRVSPMPNDVRELQNQLRHARDACNDLEMHTAQLNMQKNIMKEEIKSLSEQLTRVSTDYEVEKLNCQEIKKTWELANDHFIVAQDKLNQEIYRLYQKLERGEAVSPMREIEIEAFPTPVIVKRHAEKDEAGKEERPSRTHRRSWSTDESSEVTGPTALQRLKSASWSSLQKPSETTPEEAEALTRALEEELSMVKAELKHQKDMCASYEKQSARVQEQMVLDMREKELTVEKLSLENEKYKAHVMRQHQVYEKLCRQMEDLKEEMRTRIETFQTNEQDLKGQQRILKDKFTEIRHDTQREIAKMSEDRRQVYQQLEILREEYDCLKAIQSSCVTDYQAQLANLKQSCEETESKLNKVTVQLNSSREQMKNVRDMLAAERSSKEKMNAKFSAQLEAATRRIEELTPMVAQLESAMSAKENAVSAKAETERKSREFISEQRLLIEKLNGEKDRASTQVQELQRQVASLKHKLNHTEETQKDFVELSQSLQMKIAVMEEEIQKQDSLSPPSA